MSAKIRTKSIAAFVSELAHWSVWKLAYVLCTRPAIELQHGMEHAAMDGTGMTSCDHMPAQAGREYIIKKNHIIVGGNGSNATPKREVPYGL
jgi:hypothetical protein